jgi:methionyl-tRNA formyltransferase
MDNKKIIFMGEKPLGLKCLQLLRGMREVEVVAVCTRARGEVWWGRQEILDYCAAEKIPIIQRAEITGHVVDYLISVLYPFIIEPEYIRHARLGCFNLHEAPLPRWRGCNSYSHALLAGDSRYGTTLHELAPELDAGRIIAQRDFPIEPFETAKELYERTAVQSYQLAKEWFPRIMRGDSTAGTYPSRNASFLNPRDSLADLKYISLQTPTRKAFAKAAALDFVPWEPAFVTYGAEKYYLFIESSRGRESVTIPGAEVFAAPAKLADLDWGTFEAVVVKGLPRTMIICKADLYENIYPLSGNGKSYRQCCPVDATNKIKESIHCQSLVN